VHDLDEWHGCHGALTRASYVPCSGFDERINTAVIIRNEKETRKVLLDQYDLEPETKNVLVSQITRLRSLRIGEAIPINADDFVIYDNGQAQIYHLRPRSPFQR